MFIKSISVPEFLFAAQQGLPSILVGRRGRVSAVLLTELLKVSEVPICQLPRHLSNELSSF